MIDISGFLRYNALRGAPELGSVRAPLFPLQEDRPIVEACAGTIDALIAKFC